MTRLGMVLCVMATLATLVLRTATAAAGPFEVKEASWEGCSGLLELARAQLGNSRVVPLSQLDWSDLRAEDALLILHPDHALSSEKLAAFLAANGRVAVLDDYGAGDKILEQFKIDRVAAPTRPLLTLRHNPDLAIAEPVRQPLDGQTIGTHATVENVERLVTNHPTALRSRNQEPLTPVLKIRAIDEPDVLLALASQLKKPSRGKLFAMGDPSAVTNQMLRYPGNRSFALGLIHYLTEDDNGGNVGGRLVILTNHFSETGTFGGVGSLKSELDSRLEAAGQELSRLTRDGLSGTVGLALAALSAFGVGVWTTSVASRIYRRKSPTFARPVPLVAQGGVAGRAAVLAAETTPRELAMLELKSALEEGLAHLLGLAPPVAPQALLDALKRKRVLDERAQRALKEALRKMSILETAVLARQPSKVTDEEVLRFSRLVSELLASARERAARDERAA